MSRRRLLAGALSCLSLVLLGAGCAAIIGLDDEFKVGADGGASRAGKDSGQPGDDDDDDDDATTAGDDGGPTATDGSSASFEAGAGWQVDESFGSGGWIVLDTSVAASPPVVTADGNGALDLAAGDPRDGGVLLALGYDPAAGSPTFADSTLGGSPGDIVEQNGAAYLVVSQVIAVTSTLSSSTVTAARFEDAGAPSITSTVSGNFFTTCVGRRITGVAGEVVRAVGDCSVSGMGTENAFSFPLDAGADAASVPTSTSLGGPPQLVTDVAASDAGSWLVGCLHCTAPENQAPTGLFALVEGDGGIPSRGQYNPPNVATSLSAVLPQPDGDAWVFGISGGSFFTSYAIGAVGGTPDTGYSSLTPTPLAVGNGGSLQLEPASRTRLAGDRAGTYLLVGAIGGPAQVAVAVLEPSDGGFAFTDSFGSTAQTVAAPASASAVVVGGVVVMPVSSSSLDDFAYVATTLTVAGGNRVGLLRLLRHTLRDD
jgi:hypothetical protein